MPAGQRTSLDMHDAKEFYKFNGHGCPRAVENPSEALEKGMNKFSDEMYPVSFDEWAYAVKNREKFMPPGSRESDYAKDNFNKIWDGHKWRYVVNSDRKLCSVVPRSDILESFTDRPHTPSSTTEYLDQLEDSLTILLRNLGATIDKSVENEALKQRALRRRQMDGNQQDRDLRLIRTVEQPDDVIKPGSHGCDPLTYLKEGEQDHHDLSARTNFDGLKDPKSTTLRTRTSEVEREADKYVGRVPVETGNRRQPFACVAVTDKRLRNGKYPTIYHGLQELEQKVPQTVDARGSSVADPNQPATSGELYSLSAMCAQQLTQDECESTDQLKVTPFGNYGRRTPAQHCAFVEHPHTGQQVCAPKRIEQVLEPEAKQWYYGSAANPGGFLEHERMLVEKFRQKHAKDYRHPNVISDADLRASRDLEREMEIINSMSSGIRRFSVPAKKPSENDAY